MAVFNNSEISTNVLANLFPVCGTKRESDCDVVWMESMRLFKANEYISASGHRYIKGIRFSNSVVVALSFSFWNTWTYINSIEVYRFNENGVELLDKKEYKKVFYEETFVKTEVISILKNSIDASLKMQDCYVEEDKMNFQVQKMVDDTYCSPLSCDFDYSKMATMIKIVLQNESRENFD